MTRWREWLNPARRELRPRSENAGELSAIYGRLIDCFVSFVLWHGESLQSYPQTLSS
jgi:hypothetical protein